MSAFIAANMAPIIFGSLVLFLLLGFPVAFSLAANGIIFGIIGIELGLFQPTFFQALPERIFGGVMNNDTLLAIPFFTFMGLILERSGMAEDLLETIGQLFGPVRGGLAYAVIIVGAMLAATTGVVAASVISMGLISLPIMLRFGYDRRLASGVIAASGTLAQIIPPSLVLIIIADQLGKSVGDMYKGAFVPGFVLTGLYMAYVLGCTLVKPQWAPALPPEARSFREPSGKSGAASLLVLTAVSVAAAFAWAFKQPADKPTDELIVIAMCVGIGVAFGFAVVNRVLKLGLLSGMAEKVTFVLIPPLALIFLVLGTIFIGVATPTEGGAMGATGALIMALARKRLNWTLLKQAMDSTAKLTTFVVFILVGARIFSLTFYGVNGHLWVEELLQHLPGGQLGFLIAVNALIWFGILLGINMQTSFMHPPFGFALFYLRSVAPTSPYKDHVTGHEMQPVTTGQIYWGAIPFVLIQVVMVGIVIAFPQLVGRDEPVPAGQEQVIDIQKMLQDDAAQDAAREAAKAGGTAAPAGGTAPAAENEGDALTRAILEANKNDKAAK